MPRLDKDAYIPRRAEIKQALKDLFQKFGLDAYDVRVGIDEYGLSFQGDCKQVDRAIIPDEEKKDA